MGSHFSLIEAGKLKLHVEPFLLEALVGNATSIIRGYAEAKGLTPNVNIDPSLDGFFVGDQPRLRQVLLNLLNHRRARPAQATVPDAGPGK